MCVCVCVQLPPISYKIYIIYGRRHSTPLSATCHRERERERVPCCMPRVLFMLNLYQFKEISLFRHLHINSVSFDFRCSVAQSEQDRAGGGTRRTRHSGVSNGSKTTGGWAWWPGQGDGARAETPSADDKKRPQKKS